MTQNKQTEPPEDHHIIFWCHTHGLNTQGSTIMCNGDNWTKQPCQITCYSIRTPKYKPKLRLTNKPTPLPGLNGLQNWEPQPTKPWEINLA